MSSLLRKGWTTSGRAAISGADSRAGGREGTLRSAMVSQKTMGARLRAFRNACGLSRPQAAEALPISERTIARHESGKSPITLPGAIEYAKLYHFNVVDLIRPVDLLPGTTRDQVVYYLDFARKAAILGTRSKRAAEAFRVAGYPFGSIVEPAEREVSKAVFDDAEQEVREHLQKLRVRLD